MATKRSIKAHRFFTIFLGLLGLGFTLKAQAILLIDGFTDSQVVTDYASSPGPTSDISLSIADTGLLGATRTVVVQASSGFSSVVSIGDDDGSGPLPGRLSFTRGIASDGGGWVSWYFNSTNFSSAGTGIGMNILSVDPSNNVEIVITSPNFGSATTGNLPIINPGAFYQDFSSFTGSSNIFSDVTSIQMRFPLAGQLSSAVSFCSLIIGNLSDMPPQCPNNTATNVPAPSTLLLMLAGLGRIIRSPRSQRSPDEAQRKPG